MADQYDQRADLRVIMAKTLTFDLENSRFGVWVWGPRRLLRGFQTRLPPLGSRKTAAWTVAVGPFSQTQTPRTWGPIIIDHAISSSYFIIGHK